MSTSTEPPHALKKKYHFIGIGGIGMSGLARILLQRGSIVRGSDVKASYVTDGLIEAGAEIFIGHHPEYIKDSEVIVYSTDIPKENPEFKQALRLGLPLQHRSDLLADLMQGYAPLLVTGTHGKTTTSSLLAHLLSSAGLNPGYAVGGMIRSLNSNGAHGTGSYFVAEADESDGSFLKYDPFGAIITNIDNDHLSYWLSEEALIRGFEQFAKKVASTDHLFWHGDDCKLQALRLPGISYGFGENNGLQITAYRQVGWKNFFDCSFHGNTYVDVEVPLIGGHNVLNAAAVFGLGLSLDISEESLRLALSRFSGVNRRLEKKGESSGASIYDDYAHHPTEIFATVRAVKQVVGEGRLIIAFQPHRYSRTKDCLSEFGPAFNAADFVILTDIYSAGETPIEGITTSLLLSKIKDSTVANVRYIPFPELASFLATLLQPGDTLVTMGAGDVTKIGPKVIAERSG